MGSGPPSLNDDVKVAVMKKTLLAAALGLSLTLPVMGADAAKALPLDKQVEAKLVQAFGPRLQVREVAPLAGNQILEVVLIDGSVMHMTPDLSHFIYRDELYELGAEGPQNITQNRNNPKRAERLAADWSGRHLPYARQSGLLPDRTGRSPVRAWSQGDRRGRTACNRWPIRLAGVVRTADRAAPVRVARGYGRAVCRSDRGPALGRAL